MKIIKAEFITSAVKSSQYPPAGLKEIAFVGRSNVGKSSLINLLVGQRALAKVSGTPGKTRTINFFIVNDAFRIVDLPGYGFARVSGKEQASWARMIEDYLKNRKDLAGVVQLVDSRHAPSAQDVQMYEWLRYYGLSGLVAATKADKLSKSELGKNVALIRKTLEMDPKDVLIPISALNKTGLSEFTAAIANLINRQTV